MMLVVFVPLPEIGKYCVRVSCFGKSFVHSVRILQPVRQTDDAHVVVSHQSGCFIHIQYVELHKRRSGIRNEFLRKLQIFMIDVRIHDFCILIEVQDVVPDDAALQACA